MKKKNKYKLGSSCVWRGYDCKIRSSRLENEFGIFMVVELECESEAEPYLPKLFRFRVPIEEVEV